MPVKIPQIALILIITTILSCPPSSSKQRTDFQQWKQSYGINYTPTEDNYRKIVFANSQLEIIHHNQNKTNTYNKAINQFTALTDAEFVLIYLKPSISMIHNQTQEKAVQLLPTANLQIDWVIHGRVSPVKNQGSCASCWAFSAVAMLESYALAKQKNMFFSQQQLVDCSEDYGNSGCYGGFNFNALQYIIEKGIVQQKYYPYKAIRGECLRDGGDFKVAKMHSLKGCLELYSAIELRPLGVTVDATKWRTYGSGIYNNCDKAVNHDVLLVGVTSSYYKIKNSWGSTWGEQGFIRLSLGDTCGICEFKSYYIQ